MTQYETEFLNQIIESLEVRGRQVRMVEQKYLKDYNALPEEVQENPTVEAQKMVDIAEHLYEAVLDIGHAIARLELAKQTK